MSNKKYRITLTEKQFALIETAVEIMLRPAITMYQSEHTHTRHPECPLREVRDENMGRA